MDLIVTGADDFTRLAKRFRQQGTAGKGLRKTVRDSIRTSAKPLGRFVAVSAGRDLPRRGGLGYRVGGASVGVTANLSSVGVTARLRLKTAGYDLQAMDRGRLRHPTFGNRRAWVNQTVRAGAFTRPFEEGAPAIKRNIESGLREVAAKIEKG